MRVYFLKPFMKEYGRLPQNIQHKVDKQIALLQQDLYHPGINARKMTNQGDIWEAKVDYHYRMTFHIDRDCMFMRRVGTHEIYRNP